MEPMALTLLSSSPASLQVQGMFGVKVSLERQFRGHETGTLAHSGHVRVARESHKSACTSHMQDSHTLPGVSCLQSN